MKRLALFSMIGLLVVSCVENPDIGKEEPPVVDPTLSVHCAVVGSYSAEFVCTVGQTDRLFIGGGFVYAKTPGFEDAVTVPGMVISNELSCIVSDLEPDSHYYVKAYIFDTIGRLESGTISFDSPSFKVQGDTDFHLTYQGGTVDLTVISNDNFQIYSEVDWITGLDTRAGESFHRSVLVQPNPSLHARSATLTLASPDSYFRETVSISQDGAPVQIPDSEFKAWLVSKYDADGSSEIELAEIPSVTEIVIQSDGIRSLEGIEWFSNLEKLVCQGLSAGQLENLDLSGSPRLTYLDVSDNNLSSLDLSGCPNLKTLDCGGNHLRALELAGNQALEYLDCRGNELESLDLTDNHSLQAIHADGNRLTSLKTPRSEALAELTCRGNDLETLNLSNNRGLRRLDCSENRLQTLNVSAMSGLTYLDCRANALKELPVWRNEALETLLCGNNGITSLDLRQNALLKTLGCQDNQLALLDLSGNTNLESVDCGGNRLSTLDVSMLPSLRELRCNCPEMIYVLASASQHLEGVTENRRESHIHPDTEVRHPEDLAVIADPLFRSYLVQYYDSDGDGLLSKMEADKVTSVRIMTDMVGSLDGIEYLTGLKYLQCEGTEDDLGHPRGKLSSLDLSRNPKLEQVLCGRNRLTHLDVSGCPNLKTLWCYGNRLETLDVSACPELVDLNCEHNLIPRLDLTGNLKLVSLDCSPMAGTRGENLLQEVHLGAIRINYVNGRGYPRNSCCIPPRTTLYIGGSATSSLSVPFMFNFNAKDFSEGTRTFVNTPGALWDHDMVLNGSGFTASDSYVHIYRETYARFDFPSTGANPFNRRGQDQLTIIAKVKGETTNDFSIFACRSETSDYCYMFREGDYSTRYFYLHDARSCGSATSISVNQLPNIVAAIAGNGTVQLQSFTDQKKGTPQPISWGGPSNSISLFSGGIGGEFWTGDFYWLFLSLEALTEAEIEQVIDYNESL